MASFQPRLLVCGFGPFPGAPHNPAGRVVGALGRTSWAPPGAALAFGLIPTTWAGATDMLQRAVAEHAPDGILLVGVASGAEAFRVETRAHNRVLVERPDAAGGVHPPGAITQNGPAVAAVTGTSETMLGALLEAGLPAGLSDDPGDYLCNFALYRLLTGGGPARTGFLHLPPEGPAFPLEALEHGVRAAATAFAVSLGEGRAGRSSAA
jgi:pyroglutamyl-peptidase